MKKVIITGANGFIGSHLVNFLTSQKIFVYAVVRNENSDISKIIRNDYVKIVYCDMEQIDRFPNLITERQFDVFFNLAWEGSAGDARCDYEIQFYNLQAAMTAIQVAAALSCKKFIGVGSVMELVYEDYLRTDDCKPECIMYYPVAKMTARSMSKIRCNELGLEFCWAQIANVYGVGDYSNNFLNMLVEHYSNGKEPTLTEGEQLADFVYITDVVELLWGIGEYGKNMSTYYVGGPNIRPLKEFVMILNRMINPEVNSGLGKKKFVGRSIDLDKVDVNKLARDTGVTAKIDFLDGMKMILKYR